MDLLTMTVDQLKYALGKVDERIKYLRAEYVSEYFSGGNLNGLGDKLDSLHSLAFKINAQIIARVGQSTVDYDKYQADTYIKYKERLCG